MTESIWFTDALMRIHVSPEDTDGAYGLIEAIAPSGHTPPPLVAAAEQHGITFVGPPGIVPADLLARR